MSSDAIALQNARDEVMRDIKFMAAVRRGEPMCMHTLWADGGRVRGPMSDALLCYRRDCAFLRIG